MDKDQTTFAQSHDGRAYIAINYVFNIISIFFSLFLLIVIIALRAKQINFSNRISLRLIMYISIIEIFFSVSQMLRIAPSLPMWLTYVASWGYIFSTLLICLLISAILINLQLIFIHNYNDKNYVNKLYLIIPTLISIILSGIPVTFSNLDFDKERHSFWYTESGLEWITYQGWISSVVLYCIFLLTFVRYRLRKDSERKSQTLMDSADSTISPTSTMVSTSVPKQRIQSEPLLIYVSHIINYSLIPILSYLPSIITTLTTKNDDFILNLISLIFISSQGIFTFIIFMFDPIIDEAILEHERNWLLKQNVLDKIQKGVYVNNIYNIDLELPSSKDQKQKSNRRSKYRSTIYVYAKNRISGITSVISNKKSMEVKKDLFNIVNEEDDILYFL